MRTTDDLILDLLSTGRRVTHVEVAEIVAHVGQAPFATRLSHVPTSVRKQLHEAGVNLPAGKIRAIDWHLLKRVYLDEQWPGGTTEAEFVADLHQAVSHTQVHMWTYRYYGHAYAGFLAPSHVQHVPRAERFIFVAYSPIFGTITTGHQASSPEMVFYQGVTDLVQHR